MSLFEGYKVQQKITAMIKIYPDRVRFYKYVEPSYVDRYDLSEYNPNKLKKTKRVINTLENDEVSIRRAKNRVIDLVLSNPFDLMVTFTFDPNKIDKHDDEAVKKALKSWLNHQTAKYGKFRYILIPERHKSGALHFHGLFGDYRGRMVDSGKFDKAGRKIYNIKSYRMGFTTAVKLDNKQKVASYVTKYITKDMPQFPNKQRYWRSNKLKMPLKIVNPIQSPMDEYWFASEYKTSAYEMFEYVGVMSDKDILLMADFGRRRYDDLEVTDR